MEWLQGDGLFIHCNDYKIDIAPIGKRVLFTVWFRNEVLCVSETLRDGKFVATTHRAGNLTLSRMAS